MVRRVASFHERLDGEAFQHFEDGALVHADFGCGVDH
jgi:hypothetical protein